MSRYDCTIHVRVAHYTRVCQLPRTYLVVAAAAVTAGDHQLPLLFRGLDQRCSLKVLDCLRGILRVHVVGLAAPPRMSVCHTPTHARTYTHTHTHTRIDCTRERQRKKGREGCRIRNMHTDRNTEIHTRMVHPFRCLFTRWQQRSNGALTPLRVMNAHEHCTTAHGRRCTPRNTAYRPQLHTPPPVHHHKHGTRARACTCTRTPSHSTMLMSDGKYLKASQWYWNACDLSLSMSKRAPRCARIYHGRGTIDAHARHEPTVEHR